LIVPARVGIIENGNVRPGKLLGLRKTIEVSTRTWSASASRRDQRSSQTGIMLLQSMVLGPAHKESAVAALSVPVRETGGQYFHNLAQAARWWRGWIGANDHRGFQRLNQHIGQQIFDLFRVIFSPNPSGMSEVFSGSVDVTSAAGNSLTSPAGRASTSFF